MKENLTYKKAGVSIERADEAKREMAAIMAGGNRRILSKAGSYASLYDFSFPEYRNPVLVMKTEEPGSKQKLAFRYNRISSICRDLVNHLINDIVVTGAKPLAVQDAIICGRLKSETVVEIVRSISEACQEQDCALVGGETSEQPGVIEPELYILTASIAGIVERSKIIDGSQIREGDAVLGVASNGLHTNGYSLVRMLIDRDGGILESPVGGATFLDAILVPHRCYYKPFRDLFDMHGLHGIAHITGGGIEGNLSRILPAGLNAVLELDRLPVLPVFKVIRDAANMPDPDMLRTFNMGTGMVLVAERGTAGEIGEHLRRHDLESFLIGKIARGDRRVVWQGNLRW